MCSNIAPYPWTVIAIKYKGNIYLCEYISVEEKQEKQNISPKLKRIFKYHPMYKHHCLSECPKKTPDISNTSSNKFVCVLKRNLVNRQFLMATQMDGTDSSTPLDRQNFREWKPNQFIGLTLNCELNSQNRLRKFERFKISDTWATCFLAGIERYHIGFRNDFGILTYDRCYSIDELETISKRNWTGSMDGLEFLDYFLSTVETDLKDIDCPYTCMKYHFDEKTKFVSVTKHEGKTEYSSIPEWYLQEIDKQTNLD